MADDYTPTTEEVRAAIGAFTVMPPNTRAVTPKQFERWLAAHDAEKRAEWEAEQGERHCPPDGWFPFGSHAPYPWVGHLEFSEETDDAGMPLWERPVQVEGKSNA